MAKKRKATRLAEPQGPKEIDPKDARLTVNNYMDVADSEDEYWYKKDRLDIDSDDEPRSKRLKRQDKEDAFLEQSDEEIFEESSSEEDDDDEDERRAPAKKDGKKGAALDDDDDAELLGLGKEKDEDEIRDEGWWGSSKKEYYNADAIETEQDALVRWIMQYIQDCARMMMVIAMIMMTMMTLTHRRKKRRRLAACRPRSWLRCRRPTSPSTRPSGWLLKMRRQVATRRLSLRC